MDVSGDINGRPLTGEFDSNVPASGAGADAASITIGRDNNVRWNAAQNAYLYVKVDNEPRKLFASGPSGTQAASWLLPGHVYVFILDDEQGNELARERLDLRHRRNR